MSENMSDEDILRVLRERFGEQKLEQILEGPAEQVTVMPNGEVRTIHPGMSLRDWFAGQVLPSICTCLVGDSSQRQDIQKRITSGEIESAYAAVAQTAYEMADAMIAERTKGD